MSIARNVAACLFAQTAILADPDEARETQKVMRRGLERFTALLIWENREEGQLIISPEFYGSIKLIP